MALRSHNPFQRIGEVPCSATNPFVDRLCRAISDQSLPVLGGPEITPWVGRWREWGATTGEHSERPVFCEIGCLHGATLAQLAAATGDRTVWVGLDITYKRVVRTGERLLAAGLSGHAASIFANAQGIGQVFGPGELSGTVVFFPDPWPKKRQRKHRLLGQEAFARSLAQVTVPGGFLWVRTDVEDYAAQATATLTAGGWTCHGQESLPETLRYHDVRSTFGDHAKSAGVPTYELFFTRQRIDGVQ